MPMNETEYIYIISFRNGAKEREVIGFYLNYDASIVKYYYLTLGGVDLNPLRTNFQYSLHKFPTNIEYSDVQPMRFSMVRNTKYRIKFKNHGELDDEFKKSSRNIKIQSIVK
jgi:hypothetical protein